MKQAVLVITDPADPEHPLSVVAEAMYDRIANRWIARIPPTHLTPPGGHQFEAIGETAPEALLKVFTLRLVTS